LYHIRVSWGCIGNCSFCITKKAIGSFKSKPFEECIQEFKRGLKAGYRDFIICSDDPGAYGVDIDSSFPKLLDEMTDIEGNYNLMITGLSPVMLMKYLDEMEEILKKKKITAILFPIQSGSSRILKLMNRYSDVDKMKEAFLRLKKSFPGLILETQIILGFPTETFEDFKQSLNFVKECNFYSGYLYKFSCRPGTDAEKIEPKVSDEEMSKRLKYAKNFFRKEGYKMSYFRYGLSGLSKDMNIFHLK
jgi:tRNA A37 methylthiotransferase MiaB